MSLPDASLRSSAWPASTRQLTVMHFLLRATTGHQSDLPFALTCPHWRIGSPAPGASTLITSAPISASNCPQNGPASRLPISMTRKSVNGPLRDVSLLCLVMISSCIQLLVHPCV